jgi:hypothetical protein
MAKQSTTKSNSNNSISFSSLKNVLKMINAALSGNIQPATTLPPPLIITGGNLRGGLSARSIASRIISRRSEAGLPAGDIYPNYGNSDEIMERIRVEEIITALLTESVVQVAVQPGQTVTGSGVGNLGAPIAVQGATTSIGVGKGIMT